MEEAQLLICKHLLEAQKTAKTLFRQGSTGRRHFLHSHLLGKHRWRAQKCPPPATLWHNLTAMLKLGSVGW